MATEDRHYIAAGRSLAAVLATQERLEEAGAAHARFGRSSSRARQAQAQP
jgi:hypothetical protein